MCSIIGSTKTDSRERELKFMIGCICVDCMCLVLPSYSREKLENTWLLLDVGRKEKVPPGRATIVPARCILGIANKSSIRRY